MLYKLENPKQCQEKTKISVIIPCYQVEAYLERCIDSVFRQTIGMEQMEIILVDDASKDGTRDLIRKIEAKAKDQVIAIFLEENQGPGVCRNLAMQYASGEYLCFLDADDWISYEMLERLLLGMEEYQADYAECEMAIVDHFIKPLEESNVEDQIQLAVLENLREKQIFLLNGGFATAVMRRLYRRSFLEKEGIQFSNRRKMEDVLFSMKLLRRAKRVLLHSGALYYYYLSPESIMRNSKGVEYCMEIFESFREVYEEMEAEGNLRDYYYELEAIFDYKIYGDLRQYLELQGEEGKEKIEVIDCFQKTHFPDIAMNPYKKAGKSNE